MTAVTKKSMKYLDNSVGLQGFDREVNRAMLDLGKGVSHLAKALSNQYPNSADLMAAVERQLGLKPGIAQPYCTVNWTYVKPDYANATELSYKFLCGTSYAHLLAFAPYLQKFYSQPEAGLADRIWITVWSIEVAFPRISGGYEWWDLRELTVEQIKNLDTLLKYGIHGVPDVAAAAPPSVNLTSNTVPETTASSVTNTDVANNVARHLDPYNVFELNSDDDDDDPLDFTKML